MFIVIKCFALLQLVSILSSITMVTTLVDFFFNGQYIIRFVESGCMPLYTQLKQTD